MEEPNPAVLVKAATGTVRPELLSKLVKNKAYIYLLQNPGKIASVCKKNSSCPGKYLCTFVHLVDDSEDEESKQHRKGKTFKVVLASTKEVAEVSSTRLVQNQAYRYLWKNPGRQGLECEGHPVGIDDDTCKYVHFLTSTQLAEKRKIEKEQDEQQLKLQKEREQQQLDENAKDAGNDENDDDNLDVSKYPPASSNCNVCLDDLSESASANNNNTNDFLCCKLGHRTCKACMTRFLQEMYSRQAIVPGEIPQVYCLTKNCRYASSSSSSPPFSAGALARVVDDDAFEIYLSMYKRAVEAKALSEVSTRLREIVNMDPTQAIEAARKLEMLTIAKAMKDTTSAYMCSICKFGPILLSGCLNLLTHNNEPASRGGNRSTKRDVRNDSKYDNSCPGCGHLHKSAAEMPNWDGIVRMNITVKRSDDDGDDG